MVSAYAWCKGRGRCHELEIALAVRQYGAAAVLGRTHLFDKEMRAFKVVLTVYDVYQSYANASNLNQWVRRFPQIAAWWCPFILEVENALDRGR
jgi:hypothetical protein